MYPSPKPANFDPLAFLSQRMDLIEVSSSFHRPLDPAITERWTAAVSHRPDFRFTVRLGRHFTHERLTAGSAVSHFKRGLWPLLRAGRIGALLMEFPGDFRLNVANRDHLIRLRREFHEFPLAAEIPHESWLREEGVATFVDHRIAWVNSTGHELTSSMAYFRVHDEFPDLVALQRSVGRLAPLADRTFVTFTNESRAASYRLTLEFAAMLAGRAFEPLQPSFEFGRAVA